MAKAALCMMSARIGPSMTSWPKLLSLICGAAMLADGAEDPWTQGRARFAEGRHAEAAAALAAALAQRGDTAAPELHYDHALACYFADDLDAAQRSAEAAASSPALAPRALHLLASIEWRRGDTVAEMAMQVEAEPFLFRQAMERVARARALWQEAATGPSPASESVRNVERAVRRIEALQQAQLERDRRRKQQGAEQRPMAVPQGKDEGDAPGKEGAANQTEEEAQVQPLQAELSPERLQAMFLQLDQRERQKRDERQTRRAAAPAAERGW